MKPFEIVDHTADIGIVAYGADLRDLFTNAALGLFNLMADLDDIGEHVKREVKVSADDVEVLLVEWLNELIYIFEVDHILFKKFVINELSGNRIVATCFGEKTKQGQHIVKREIKAATYHMLKIEKDNGRYKVQIIFDV